MPLPRAITVRCDYPTMPVTRDNVVDATTITLLDLRVTAGPAGSQGRPATLELTMEQARNLVRQITEQIERSEQPDRASAARIARDQRIIRNCDTAELRRIVDDPEPGAPAHLITAARAELATRGQS